MNVRNLFITTGITFILASGIGYYFNSNASSCKAFSYSLNVERSEYSTRMMATSKIKSLKKLNKQTLPILIDRRNFIQSVLSDDNTHGCPNEQIQDIYSKLTEEVASLDTAIADIKKP